MFRTTALIISNQEMRVKNILKSLGDSNILIKSVTQTTENETKEQRGEFLGMSFDTLGANVLGSMLAGKGVIRAGNGIHGAGQDFSCCLIL